MLPSRRLPQLLFQRRSSRLSSTSTSTSTAADCPHHKALGLERGASPHEIKQAYLKHAKLYHPDMSTTPGSSSQFLAVRAAYERLTAKGQEPTEQEGAPEREFISDSPGMLLPLGLALGMVLGPIIALKYRKAPSRRKRKARDG